VIPTAWIEAAQARWKPQAPRQQLTAIAVDVAQGGDDFTVLAKRYGGYFPALVCKPGKETRPASRSPSWWSRSGPTAVLVIIDAGGGYGSDAVSKLGAG
jgi:hypothetical protein